MRRRPRYRQCRPGAGRETVFDVRDVSVFYGTKRAVGWTTLKIFRHLITAVIGPSGCGKSTFLRSLNRMNDSIPGFKLEGQILYHGHDVYGGGVNRVEVRRRIGMVFQKPNPFPKSIFDNVAWAPRNLGMKSGLDERVEQVLRDAALWDEVKDKLHKSALGLSGGQQQRLCIARAVAVNRTGCSTGRTVRQRSTRSEGWEGRGDDARTLKQRITIVIVTHNMQQAVRVADQTAFFSLDTAERVGTLVEYDDTRTIFNRPRDYADARLRHRAVRLGRARPQIDPGCGPARSSCEPHCQQNAALAAVRRSARRARARRSRSGPCAGSARPRRARRPRPGAPPHAGRAHRRGSGRGRPSRRRGRRGRTVSSATRALS